jgi:hypothetical protein
MMADDRPAATDRGPEERPGVGPRPLGSNLADLAELLGGDTQRSRRFLGGLVVGALVGAAIAGSALLRRHGQGIPD